MDKADEDHRHVALAVGGPAEALEPAEEALDAIALALSEARAQFRPICRPSRPGPRDSRGPTPRYLDGRRSWAFQMRLRMGRPSPAGSTNSGR